LTTKTTAFVASENHLHFIILKGSLIKIFSLGRSVVQLWFQLVLENVARDGTSGVLPLIKLKICHIFIAGTILRLQNFHF
jgi:hypothetical protein